MSNNDNTPGPCPKGIYPKETTNNNNAMDDADTEPTSGDTPTPPLQQSEEKSEPTSSPDGRHNPAYRKWRMENVEGERERERARTQKWRKTDKGKAYTKAYQQSDAGRAAHKKYQDSEKGKATQRRFAESEKGIAARQNRDKHRRCVGCGITYKVEDVFARQYKVIGEWGCLCDLCVEPESQQL